MSITIAIIGRPNVGKSTLFNRLAGKKLALVDSRPGVTRDRRETTIEYGNLRFNLVDTAGLEEGNDCSLVGRMREQTLTAINRATANLIVIDGRIGLTPMDRHYAELVRRSGKIAIVVVNKAESSVADATIYEAFGLGFGDPIALSAEHGDGITDLLDRISEIPVNSHKDAIKFSKPEKLLNLSIVGRPNTGKSTLFNSLVGESRALTGPEPGVTHDSIHVDWRYNERNFRLVDTAGLRRKPQIQDSIEKLSFADTIQTIRYSDIVVLMLDATQKPSRQDVTIAEHVTSEGRGLVICANKWDLVHQRASTSKKLLQEIKKSLPQLGNIPLITCSAINGDGIDQLMTAVFEIYKQWCRRIPTALLNQWLAATISRHPPPLANRKLVKMRYISQYANRPPRFVIFSNRPKKLPESYRRYLTNELRASFDFHGVPIRIFLKSGRNPYVKND